MHKKRSRSNVMNFAAFICFLLALGMIIFLRLSQMESVLQWYQKYTDALSSFEQWIQQNGATWYSVLIILANFMLKAVIPWFPLSCICVACGVLFPAYFAIPINAVGAALLFTIKYFWGKRYGGGNAEKLLAKNEKAEQLVERSKIGSAVVLFFLRFFPCIPINAVSRLYGTSDIGYWKYLIVSLLGFSYKLFSYTIIGRSVYDPMSASFLLPFILLFILSGLVLLAFNGVVSLSKGEISLS